MPPPNGGDGNGLSLGVSGPGGWGGWVKGRDTVLILVLIGALTWMVYVTLKGFERLETAAAEQRAGREGAVAAIALDHRDLLCMLAIDQADRKMAIRSGDVCGWIMGSRWRDDRHQGRRER
jgi:hypothetical protein